jgi:cytochrome P450
MTPDIPATLLLDAAVLEDPYPFYARLRQEAPFWRVPGTQVFVASSYAVIDEITARTDDFSNVVRTLLYRGDGGISSSLTSAPRSWRWPARTRRSTPCTAMS